MSDFDFIVIGAGMAGASVAAELSAQGSVAVLEMEERAGYHTTGRSAAAYEPNYGTPPVLAFTRASKDFYFNPQVDFTAVPLFSQRSSLVLIPDAAGEVGHDYLGDSRGVQEIGLEDMLKLVPILRRDYASRGLLSTETGDLDVDAIHQAYLRRLRKNGGKVFLAAGAEKISRQGKAWQIVTAVGAFEAPVVINAAGAWGDVVAKRAGVAPIGLQPKRRSMAVVPVSGYPDFMRWPFLVDVSETWYAKPQSGKLLISPADATPVEPHDAHADDETLAGGIERFMQATTYEVTRVERSWGGLRTFTPDRTPCIGFDPDHQGFFWLVGQGGYGIMTAPGISRTAAALAMRQPLPEDVAAEGLKLEDISPVRFR